MASVRCCVPLTTVRFARSGIQVVSIKQMFWKIVLLKIVLSTLYLNLPPNTHPSGVFCSTHISFVSGRQRPSAISLRLDRFSLGLQSPHNLRCSRFIRFSNSSKSARHGISKSSQLRTRNSLRSNREHFSRKRIETLAGVIPTVRLCA